MDHTPSEILAEIFTYAGQFGPYVVPRVCLSWRDAYQAANPRATVEMIDDYPGCDFFALMAQIDEGNYADIPDEQVHKDAPEQPLLDICIGCAFANNFELLKWANNDGYRVRDITRIGMSAIAHDNLQMFEWAVSRGCRLSSGLIACAARNGRLRIVKWLYENGAYMNDAAFDEAFTGNHVAIMQYIHETGYIRYGFEHYVHVGRFATDETYIWLHEHEYLSHPVRSLRVCMTNGLYKAADYIMTVCHDECIKYDIPWSCESRADSIKWLITNGIVVPTEDLLMQLVARQWDNTLNYVIENTPDIGSILKARVMDVACQYNQSVIIELHSRGCPWSDQSLMLACANISRPLAAREHIDAIVYMVRNGAGTHDDAIKWLTAHSADKKQ